MRVPKNSKRRPSGADNPQLILIGQKICRLQRGETERFVMKDVTSRPQQNLWRSRVSKHVGEFGVAISIRWFEHIMVVQRL